MDAIKTIMLGSFLVIAGCGGGGGKSGGASLQTTEPKYDIASYVKNDVDPNSLSGVWMLTASGVANVAAESSDEPNSTSKVQLRQMVTIVEQSSGIIDVQTCGNDTVSTTATGNTLSFDDDGDHLELHVVSNTSLEGTSVLEGGKDTLKVKAVKIANAAQTLGMMNFTNQLEGSSTPNTETVNINCLSEADSDTTYSGNGFSGTTHDRFLTVGFDPEKTSVRAFSIIQSKGTVNGQAVDSKQLVVSLGSSSEFSAPAPDTDMPVANVTSDVKDISASFSGIMSFGSSRTISISGDFALKLP